MRKKKLKRGREKGRKGDRVRYRTEIIVAHLKAYTRGLAKDNATVLREEKESMSSSEGEGGDPTPSRLKK